MNTQSASLFKRFAAIIYDLFLLAALLFIAEILPVSLNHGVAISEASGVFIYYFVHPMYLLLVCFVFFGWFWTHGGQTLGMKTWRLQLQTLDGGNISWSVAGVRFLAAIVSWMVFGLGFIWSLFDSRKRTWHDMMSGTMLIQLEKKKK